MKQNIQLEMSLLSVVSLASGVAILPCLLTFQTSKI